MPLVIGKSVDPKKAEKELSRVASELREGEAVWFYAKCNTFRPQMEAVVVTDHRLLGISTGFGGQGCVYRVAHEDIVELVSDQAATSVVVRTSDTSVTFKRMSIEDAHALVHYVNHARQARSHPAGADHTSSEPDTGTRTESEVTDERVREATPTEVVPPPEAAVGPFAAVAAEAIEALHTAARTHVTVFGRKTKPDKVAKQLAQWPLLPGEFVWLYVRCSTMSPMMDAVVVTNARLLGVNNASGIRVMATHPQIVDIETNLARNQMSVRLAERIQTFKQMDRDDIVAVRECLRIAREHPPEEPLALAAAEAVEADRGLRHPTNEERDAARSQKKQDKAADKERRSAEKAEAAAKDLAVYGECVCNEIFGAKSVRLYANGYARVAFMGLGSGAPYERLIGVETSIDAQKKSGFGRAVGAAATAGISLYASNKRGDVWVTVITESRTHVLHEDPPTALNIAQAKKIAGVGAAVAGRAPGTCPLPDSGLPSDTTSEPATPPPSAETNRPVDLAARLRSLKALLDEGLITEVEYDHKRAILLDEL